MTSYSNLNLLMIAWLLFTLLIGATQITAAILLLRERHMGPWMMLIGGIIALIGSVGNQLLWLFRLTSTGSSVAIVNATSAFSALGHLAFAIGLLLHALRRRALAIRIVQLEAILHSQNP